MKAPFSNSRVRNTSVEPALPTSITKDPQTMPFDVSGEPIHTRCLAVACVQGDGEAVEFRADLMDLRKGGLMSLGDRITMAGIIHKMELRGSFSTETGAIERIEWDQSHVMHEPNLASKGECCRDPLGRLEGLIGVRLGEGFASTLKQTFGGPLGCTHISTLFQELSAFVANGHSPTELPDHDQEHGNRHGS